MSLFALPVTDAQITSLQLGITFSSDSTEADAKRIEINAGSDTVNNYANLLWDRMLSLGQVAMLVDTLMNGTTDVTSELSSLTNTFLPPQVANAIANGLNPTVYAAEACGLALAGYRSFWSTYGNVTGPGYISAVASLTGVDQSAISGWLTNWANFYTANPPSGISISQAARGATFGDACGVVLTSPTANATIIALNAQIKNAQMCIATGQYSAGATLSSLPTHTAFQGA